MTTPNQPVDAHPSVVRLPWWAAVVAVVAFLAAFAVLQENGLVLGHAADTLHEFFHDGRHALGVPCH